MLKPISSLDYNLTPESDKHPQTLRRKIEKNLHTRLLHDLNQISSELDVNPTDLGNIQKANQKFPMLIPESLIERIKPGDLSDGVFRQFVPSEDELRIAEGFTLDPLQEFTEKQVETSLPCCILQKYAGRALVITTNACAARCRFCFRRFFPKNHALFPLPRQLDDLINSSADHEVPVAVEGYLNQLFQVILQTPSINEIIFSGGDPLTLSNKELKLLLHYTDSIRHVNRVRFHSRVPILTPLRIDQDFPVAWSFTANNRKRALVLHIVLHVNHPAEISPSVEKSLLALRQKGYILTSQTVLLHGINDRVDVLKKLYEKLIDNGVVPYYLHQLDRVQGAAHFETPVAKGRELMKQLCQVLPGYAMPRYVREVPGFPSKTDLFMNQDITQ